MDSGEWLSNLNVMLGDGPLCMERAKDSINLYYKCEIV